MNKYNNNDIFFCYSRKDIDEVIQICDKITASIPGKTYWLDVTSHDNDEALSDETKEAIQKSKIFLVMVSDNLLDSEYFYIELEAALESRILIRPVGLKGGKFVEDFRIPSGFISVPECLDFYNQKDREALFMEISSLDEILSVYDKEFIIKNSYYMAVGGHMESQLLWGSLYIDGDYFPHDYSKAVFWLAKAAEKGNIEAQCNLGYCYEQLKDFSNAIKWYRCSAEKGNTYGQCNLARCYLKGIGVTKDYNQALQWFEIAAHQGSADGVDGVERIQFILEYSESSQKYIQRAKEGDVRAQINLGIEYLSDENIIFAQDLKMALYWLEKAADQGNSKGQYELGNCYKEMGKSFQAAYWYKMAAGNGNAHGQHSLAECYENAIGLPQDCKQALIWYKKALSNGLQEAKSDVERVENILSHNNEDEDDNEQNEKTIEFGSSYSEQVYRRIDVYTPEQLETEITDNAITHDITIRKGTITNLSTITTINGSLGLSNCDIETLSPLKFVTGGIWCSFQEKEPKLKTLGTLQRIGGNASFKQTNLECLGALEYVGGDLSLRGTKINDLGKLYYVGGNLYLPKRLQGLLDLSKVEVKGVVKYWNDMKKAESKTTETNDDTLIKPDRQIPNWRNKYIYPDTSIKTESKDIIDFYIYFKEQFLRGVLLDLGDCTNYSFMLLFELKKTCRDVNKLAEYYKSLAKICPKVAWYSDDILIEKYLGTQDYENAWNIIKNSQRIYLGTIYFYQQIIGTKIFDINSAIKICGSKCLSDFGKSHLEDLQHYFSISLSKFESYIDKKFFDLLNDIYDEAKKHYITECFPYTELYYHRNYIHHSLRESAYVERRKIREYEFSHKKEIAAVRNKIRTIEQSVTDYLSDVLINAENLERESVGKTKRKRKMEW